MPSLVALVTTISGVIVTPLSIACEREQGTFDQFLVPPLIPGMIMVGKTVLAVLIAITQGAMILLAAAICYRVTFEGSLILLSLGSFFCGTSVSSIGLLISSIL